MLTTKKLRDYFSGKPHVATIRRWVRKGILVDGERVKLACDREGGRMVFTAEHVAEFKRRLNNREGT
jgi:hypothetical protein